MARRESASEQRARGPDHVGEGDARVKAHGECVARRARPEHVREHARLERVALQVLEQKRRCLDGLCSHQGDGCEFFFGIHRRLDARQMLV